MKSLAIVVVAAALLAHQETAHGELIRWRLGGPSGPHWTEWTKQNTLADISTDPTVLQPLELDPDKNLVPQLAWTRYKFPIVSYFRPGMPRIWPGTGEISTPRGYDPMPFIDGAGTVCRVFGRLDAPRGSIDGAGAT